MLTPDLPKPEKTEQHGSMLEPIICDFSEGVIFDRPRVLYRHK